MSSVGTEPAQGAVQKTAHSSLDGASKLRTRSLHRSRGRLILILLIIILFVVAAGAYYVVSHDSKPPLDLNKAFAYVQQQFSRKSRPAPDPEGEPIAHRSSGPWNGTVEVKESQARAIGLQLVEVKPQSDPIRLELTGRTAYDPNSLNKIRPRFDTLVESVHAEPGQLVRRGDPLVDLFSTELASAKNDFQTKYVQWQRDLRVLKLKEKLVVNGAVSQQNYVDAQNDETKSRLEYFTARDKFRVLGVPVSEIDPLIENLGEKFDQSEAQRTSTDKAKMTLRSPVEGIVIQREVVPDNLYDETNVLMVIGP